MSTYASAVWVDVRPDGPVTDVARALDGVEPDQPVWVDVDSAWVRLTTYLPLRVEVGDEIAAVLATAGNARAAIAEDHDEFGASWTVLSAAGGVARTVHRRYLLNADPRSRRQVRLALRAFERDGRPHEPRDDDVAGPQALADVALLFDADPARVLAAEVRAEKAFEDMGVVGGPFPWVEALGLVWPGPDAGRPFGGRTA